MPESANLKKANPKKVNPKKATVRVPATASASTAGRPPSTVSVKAPPQARAPFSTGSPLLDSFMSHSAEESVYIPNPHITGNRVGSRQGPIFSDVTLNGPAPQPSRARFDGEDFKRAGLASAAVPIKKASKAIQLKSQPPQSDSKQQSETTEKHRQPNGQTAANTQTTTQLKKPSQDPLNKQPSSQPKGKQTVEKLGQKAPQKTAGKSAKPTSTQARQSAQPGTQDGKPVSRQNGVRPSAAPKNFNPAAASSRRVYGGSDYKALQSRAAAGGLVDLEDTLLFGGAEDKSSPLSIGNAPPGVDNNPGAVLEYLLTLPSDFVLTKPEGNRAILDDFSWLERPDFVTIRAVLDARDFKVIEQPSPQTQTVQPRHDQASANDSAELKALTQKIDQLHQRIEYLSERLASFDAAPSAETPSAEMPSTETGVIADIFEVADIDHSQPTASTLFQAPSII